MIWLVNRDCIMRIRSHYKRYIIFPGKPNNLPVILLLLRNIQWLYLCVQPVTKDAMQLLHPPVGSIGIQYASHASG